LAGEFENSDSPYGTFDQGGNLSEWNEADIYGDGSARNVRGGDWSCPSFDLRASSRGVVVAEGPAVGFRVASPSSSEPVPEPGAVVALVGMLLTALVLWRRRWDT